MNCINCGAPAEAATPVFQCPCCGGFNQAVPVVLAQALRIETINETATAIVPSFIQSFSTGMDHQQAVSVHLLQGDGEKLEQNRNVDPVHFRDCRKRHVTGQRRKLKYGETGHLP